MKKPIIKFLFVFMLLPLGAFADEGMWLPMFLNKIHSDMQSKGLKLTPEEIYSVNNSSLKDAIVRLGGGFCTGEMISSQGLMLTNHHCGFNVIQEHSTPEHDYLTNGFWAMTKEQELPAGFSVSYLKRMEDVSERINKELNESMTEEARAQKVDELKRAIIDENKKASPDFDYQIKGFYKDNEYYMLVYETFRDVRLVGAPPSSIGKFGGDTDNWMWPRHTGDFTMFRVYANKDNKPADYSKDNVPYKPNHHLPIAMNGVEKGDYAMIFGYPGSTDRYLTSWGVKFATDKEQPARVKIRRAKLDLYEEGQAKSDKIRIQYAAKHAQVSNYWKYFIGQTRGLKRLKVYDKKKAQEESFMTWVNQDPERKKKYGEIPALYEKAYKIFDEAGLAETYMQEAIFGIEIVQHGFGYVRLKSLYDKLAQLKKEKAEAEQIQAVEAQIKSVVEALKGGAKEHFKDYNMDIDKKVFVAMLQMYDKDITNPAQKPKAYLDMLAKYKGDYNAMAEAIFAKSFLTSEEKEMAFLNAPNSKTLDADPSIQLSDVFLMWYYTGIGSLIGPADEIKTKADRLYVAGLREMNPEKAYSPDANSTMRVTYGNVLDYYPQDAVYYKHFTTLEGIMEKEDPKNDEFVVPQKLKDLYNAKDYGKYADKDGYLHTCFISNNDITGGNSGSPVINGKGQLIGTAFDGNWEAMSGDVAFEPNLQRTISVDVRYTLFIIDKFAGAGHLVDEMTLVYNEPEAPKVEAPKPVETPKKVETKKK